MNKPNASKKFYLIAAISILSSFSLIYAGDISSYNVNIKQINSTSITSPEDIQILDGKAYILSGGQLFRIDISDPWNLKDKFSFSGIAGAEQMAFLGRYAYLAIGTRVYIYDISSNPPTMKNYFEANGSIARMSVTDGYLIYIRKDLGVFVYDLKYPDSPFLRGSQIVSGDANGLYLKDNKAYVTCFGANLAIIDYNDPVKLPIVGTYTFGMNFYDVYVNDNTAYLSQGSTGVQVINVKNPASPKWLTNIFSRKFSKQVLISNYYAWVNDDNTIQAFYIKDSSSYLYAGAYDNQGYTINRLAVVDGKYIFACSSDNLFKVLQIEYNY